MSVVKYILPTKEERQIASYTGTMMARDHRWMQSPRYSQAALLGAHLRRIGEICQECPPTEIQMLKELQGFIDLRFKQILERLSPDAD